MPSVARPLLVGFIWMAAFAPNFDPLRYSATPHLHSFPTRRSSDLLPDTIVWPLPVSLPPDHVIAPLAVTIPEPVSVAPASVIEPLRAPVLRLLIVQIEMLTALPRLDSVAVLRFAVTPLTSVGPEKL